MAKAVYVGVGSKAHKMKKAYIGIGGKARKVKKMYIGVGGKARLCYSAELEKVGMATALSTTRYDMRAATVGKYALFAGGYISKSSFGYSVSSSVDAYNTSLTKSTPTELSCKRCGHAAASVGGYALFAGGASSYNLLKSRERCGCIRCLSDPQCRPHNRRHSRDRRCSRRKLRAVRRWDGLQSNK